MNSDFAPDSAWQFDHLGVVVASLEKGRAAFGPMFGLTQWTDPIDDPVNGVRLQFGRDPAGVVYELLVPLDENSPVYAALKGRKNILNHVAYRVGDLTAAAAQIRTARAMPIAPPNPAIAFGNRPIQFFVTSFGMIVELIEALDFAHDFRALRD